ncbi:MAG: hypothetical protein Q9191_001859 [Dirinaria sp. TL-2023a]
MTRDTNYRRILVGSPSSSDPVPGSFQNTPETQPTAISPEEVRSEQRVPKAGISRQSVPPAFGLHVYPMPGPGNHVSNISASNSLDPFVVSSRAAAAGYQATGLPKPSPSASSFTPSTGVQPVNLPASAGNKHGEDNSDHHSATPRPRATLSSFLPSQVGSSAAVEAAASANAQPHPVGSSESNAFDKQNFFPSLKHLGLNELAVTETVYASFSDIRDTLNAYTKVQAARPGWTLGLIGTIRYFEKYYPGLTLPPLVYEGQVSVKVEYGGPDSCFDVASIGVIVKEILENYGDVNAMEVTEINSPAVTFRAEYYDSVAVNSALTSLQGFRIAVSHDGTGLEHAMGNMNLGVGQATYGQATYGHNYVASPLVSPYFTPPAANRSFGYHRELNSQQVPSPLVLQKTNFNEPGSAESSPWSPFFSPYGDYGLQSPLWTPYTPGTIGQERGTPVMSPYPPIYPYQQRTPVRFVGRSPNEYPSSHHNFVDVERIRQGLDVRTTIMLRNIPNKIDQTMLKEIVDETSHGKYDFMYLRIDFANNCK